MAALRNNPLDRILGRLDDLDSTNLTILVQRLARERALLETVFDSIQEGVLVTNPMGTIDYSNFAAMQMLGIREEDLGKVTLWKILPSLKSTLSTLPHISLSGETTITRELEITYPEHRHVRLFRVPFANPTDEEGVTRFAYIFSDTTEQKEVTQELIESERISSIFMLAAGVAHEIGNPLNSITIHLQLIERHLAKMSGTKELIKIKHSLQVCQNEVQRLDGIITNFLAAIKPTPPDFQDINLLVILAEVINFQKVELENQKICVEIAVNDNIPIISADKNQVKQVFFNVIKNAREAMHDGGQITITSEADDDFVYIKIADTGVGIPQEALSRVFQPYYTTKQDGHGLGMMLVQRILRAHGGSIGLESRENQGTVVTLQFPQKHRRVRMLENNDKDTITDA